MGFLNPQGDDQDRIDAMPGTSEVPPPGALEGLATAIPKGITSGLVKVGALASDIADGVDHSMVGGAYQSDFGGDLLAGKESFLRAPDLHDPNQRLPGFAGDLQAGGQAAIDRAHAATQVAAEWAATGQDPRKTGTAGRIVAGTSEGLTIGAAGNAVAGPWGAATLLGSSEGYAADKDAQAQGVDATTAQEQGLVTGLTSAASVFLPLKYGKAAWQSILGGVGANVALGAAQRGLTSEVLDSHGYHEMAGQYRIFDGEAMAADTLLGAAFGVMGHFSPHAAKAVDPADVDAAAAVATENHFNRSAPGIPTDPGAATLHADTMADALHSLADGDLPDMPADRAQALVQNMVPDPAHDTIAPLHAAAQMELPGFEAAAADIKPIEMPPEEIPPPKPEPKPEPEPAAAGEPAKEPDVPLDDFHGAMLDHLVHNYGDEKYIDEHGQEKTFREMANEMQKQRNEADAFAKLHDVAAACAARNGV